MTRKSFMMHPDNESENVYIIPTILWNLSTSIWNQIKKIPSMIWWLITVIYSVFGYYLMWVGLHYLALHLYPMYCAPLSVLGFILSPFMVSAPHCVAMRWLIAEGSNVIVTMWVAVGAYAIQLMIRKQPDNI
jgi:hypothetical protein